MNGDDDDPADKTPPQTPSAQLRLGIVMCPRCQANGNDPDLVGLCKLCKGGKRVGVDTAIKYNQQNPK